MTSPTTALRRGPVTDALIALLRAGIEVAGTAVLVGDMTIPPGGGWPAPGPNAPGSSFVPYLIVIPGQGVPAPWGGSLADPQGDWNLPYGVQAFGVTRDQVEWMADATRDVLAAWRNTVLEVAENQQYKVSQVRSETIGAISRVPGANPAYYGQTDQHTLWLARQRST